MFRYLQYMLEVQNKDGVLVVDSRLIAEELGIQHKSLLETADSHITEIEFSPLGTLSFDEREFKTSQGNTCKERWIWLTEGQANFLMSLSRNTEKVVQAKLNLVVAFEKAKHALQKQEESLTNLAELIQNMHQELINQRMQMNVLTERTQRLDAVEQELAQINEAGLDNPGCAEILRDEDTTLMTTKDYCESVGIAPDHWHTISTRAAQHQRVGTQSEPERNKDGKRLLQVRYLRQAAKSRIKF